MKKKMHKILSMVLASMLIAGFIPISKELIEDLSIKATAASMIIGDLDDDQKVTAADARLVLRAAVGLETFDSNQTARADVDSDRKITAADARLILRAAVGLEDFFSLNDNSQTVDENKRTEFKNGDTIYVETEEHLVFDKSSSTHFYDNLILVYTFTRTDDVKDNYLASLVDGIIVGKLTGCINLLQIMVNPCDYNQITAKCRILAEDENVLSARFEIPFHVENTTNKTSSYDSDPWSSYQKYPISDKNDEVIGGNDWWAEAIGAYDAWMKTDNIIQQIRIGVIDNGFYIEHPDLKEKISVLTDYYPFYDGANHGTEVAGLIAASNNDFGIRGVCNSAELLCIDRTGSDGKGELLTEIQFVEATKHLLEQGCRVINNSYARWFITESEYQKKLRDGDIDVDEYPSLESYNNAVISDSANSAIAYMEMIVGLLTSKEKNDTINNQFMFVHAAGNGYNNGTEGFDAQYAGFYAGINNELYNTHYSEKKQQKLLELGASFNDIKNHIIVVGAVNKTPTQSGNFYLTTWSNFGDTVDLCAPGDDVFSTVFAQTTRQYSFGSKVYTCDFGSGTSLAAPIVSGSAALLWAVDSSLSAKEVKDYLCRNTPHIAIGVGKNDAKPYPMLHIGNAIDRLLKDKEKIGTVSGFVKDSATEKPLSDVTVTFTNNESEATYSATTDETGAFNCTVPYGEYSVEFNKDGYEYYGMSFTIKNDQTILIEDLFLLAEKENNNHGSVIAEQQVSWRYPQWTLYEDGTFLINAHSSISYTWETDRPWDEYKDLIKYVTITSEQNDSLIVGEHAFSNCKNLISVRFPDSLTQIGFCAFSHCESLTDIIIPEGLEDLGGAAFLGCKMLKKITIPDGPTALSQTFQDCESLEYVGLPSTIKTTYSSVFQNCKALKSIDLPDGLEVIGPYTFEGCVSLMSIVLPDSTKTIDRAAFRNCISLNDIILKKTLYNIREEAFVNTAYYNNSTNWDNGVLYIGTNLIEANSYYFEENSITTAKIRNNTTCIAEYAFRNMNQIVELKIPNSIIGISGSAFAGCKRIKKVLIPNACIYVGDNAFCGCEGLSNIVISAEKCYFGECVFHNTAFDNNVNNWDNGLLYCGKYLIDSNNNTVSSDVKIKEGTLGISKDCLNGKQIKSLLIPSSICIMGDGAFANCKLLETVTICDGVSRIASNAFNGCFALVNLNLPKQMDEIGENAFLYCTSLKSFRVPQGIVKLDFLNSTDSLEDVYIPKSVSVISPWCFYPAKSLKKIYYEGNETQWKAIDIGGGNYISSNMLVYNSY